MPSTPQKPNSLATDIKSAGILTIGLDFGTSNTSMATSNETKVNILHNNRGETQTPSILAFDGDRILIGDETTASTIKLENIIFGMKRLIGCSYEKLKQKKYRHSQTENDNNKLVIKIDEKRFHVVQLTAILLSKLKEMAICNNNDFKGAVLTVPSSFGPLQRRALEDAADIAKLQVLDLLDETTAAAVAFACKKMVEKSRIILIFQLGGGHIDIAVFCIAGHAIELLSSVASGDIGGEDFTQSIVNYAVKKFSSNFQKASTSSKTRAACEKAKKDLTLGDETKIKIEEEELKYSRRSFEAENKCLLDILGWMLKSVILAANLKNFYEIDNYFVAGRSTIMPSIKQMLKKYIGEEKRKDIVNAGDAAVTGAAIWAESLVRRQKINLRVFNNTTRKKVIITDGKISRECYKVFKKSALQKQLDCWSEIGQMAKFNIEFVVQAVIEYQFSKDELQQMAKKVQIDLEADKKWLNDDQKKTALSEEIHQLQEVCDSKAAEKLLGECNELDEWICNSENLSEKDLEAIRKKVEDIRKKLAIFEQKRKVQDTTSLDDSNTFNTDYSNLPDDSSKPKLESRSPDMKAVGTDSDTTSLCVAMIDDEREKVFENNNGNLAAQSSAASTKDQTLNKEPTKHMTSKEPVAIDDTSSEVFNNNSNGNFALSSFSASTKDQTLNKEPTKHVRSKEPAAVDDRSAKVSNEVNVATPLYAASIKDQTLNKESAKPMTSKKPENAIYHVKRITKGKFDLKLPNDISASQFKEETSANMRPLSEIILVSDDQEGETFCPEEISASVSHYMKQIFRKKLDEETHDAVVTFPAYFNNKQRTATEDAVKSAGYNILDIINEPIAAAIAFGFEVKYPKNCNILIFDFGSTTLDITFLKTNEGKFDVQESKRISIGGDDLTNRLVDYVVEYMKTAMEKDITNDKEDKSKLWKECEKAKIQLSCSSNYTFSALDATSEPLPITRKEFESFNKGSLTKIKNALKMLEKEDIHFVLPVGGSCKMPCVIKMLTNYFKKGVVKVNKTPEQTISKGVAIFAAYLKSHQVENVSEMLSKLLLREDTLRKIKRTLTIKRNSKESKKLCDSKNSHKVVYEQMWQKEEKQSEDREHLGTSEKLDIENPKEEKKREIKESQVAKDELKSTLNEIKGRNKEDSEVIKKCYDIAMWLQQNEDVGSSEIRQKKEDIIEFEKEQRRKALQEAKDDLNSTLNDIKDRNKEHSEVLKRCEKFSAKWLQKNQKVEISVIQQKKEDLVKFEKQAMKKRRRALEKGKDDLTSTLRNIKHRNTKDLEIIKRCEEVERWLEQIEKVSEIEQKKKEIENFEKEKKKRKKINGKNNQPTSTENKINDCKEKHPNDTDSSSDKKVEETKI